MNATEISALLTVCASFDQRKPNPETVPAWLAALGDLDFLPCRDAVVAHYQESREWIMPADIRGRVRRARATAIRNDEALELPPHDPDDTGLHARLLAEQRRLSADGKQGYQPQGLVSRSLRELGGPVRRVNELDDAERTAHAAKAKAAHAAIRSEKAAKPQPVPDPPAVFACEHRDDDVPCGQPAPHVSLDRRTPLCDGHRETAPTEEMSA